ncbi:MAG: hypothetical protein IJZ34_03405 [Lachnospiraceae bacterium]|nr:hypothetical protein [Lachnospiraceae bacterium]
MDIQVLMLLATIVSMLTGIAGTYFTYKSYRKRKRGRPKSRNQGHPGSQANFKCDVTADSNVTISVNMQITAQPASDDGYLHK